MADIKAGDEISADWWPPTQAAEDDTANDNVTSTTFVTGTPTVAVTFTAPSSGRVAVCLVGGIDQDEATFRAFISYEMYEGTSASGTLVRDARTGFGVSSPGGGAGADTHQGNMSMVSGLTPGATHYARVMHATEGGTTNDIVFRRIIVFPLP